ncbi:glycosyl transferase [Carbonactinospora thermoautotrophica]|uniref:glycosyltransferase family 9 protein n=1 Tax=Carbonactinospora thermoautotrophica TaxID=1469144 RepID=UPI0022702C34|nr:glycosyltransferase family 9 protein [Carbonactinospora thermoautotrophica]MCX9192083.1 glycosyl transferase [Carbonactinospora thermoautotrophica]
MAGALVPGVRKIAVLRANALGDFIMVLPALDALRAAYPEAEIVLLGKEWHADFLAGRPGPVDRVEVVPADLTAPEGESESPALRRFLARLRAERFDLALQLHGGGRHANPLVSALGARVTAGCRADDAPPLDRWIRYVYYQPEVFRFLEVVGLVGAQPVGVEPVLELTGRDVREVAELLGALLDGRPLAALHPGAGDPRRRWPAERFAEVGDALAEAGAAVVITGTPGEAELVRQVAGEMRRPALDLAGRLSIGGLAALYARCAVVVANDTGPLHVARAVGAATVGVYWCGNLINAGPMTRDRHRPQISWRIHCPVCGVNCTRDLYPARGGGAGCRHRESFVAEVPASEVVAAALELFGYRTERAQEQAGAGSLRPSRGVPSPG